MNAPAPLPPRSREHQRHAATAVTVRRAVVATVVVVGWSLFVGAYAWLGEPGWIEVSHGVVGAPAPGATPFRIVELGDLHLRGIGERERRVAAAAREAGPDLVVLCGDLVDGPDSLPDLDAFLALLGGGPRIVAVLGSSERWFGVELESLRAVLSHRGATLLVNEALGLEHAGRRLAVIGVDDASAGHADPLAAARGAAGVANVLAVSHSPAARDDWNGPRPTFMLAAATHGGQVAFLGYAPALPPGSGDYLAGWYRGAPFDVYVSRGVGTSVLPIRFGARPEVVVIDWWLRT
jgi:predicted MPP superfamily phosphohydrolase